ncbi:hypothetical protein TNCV_2499791 [Trichonephila clavipes]|nr:hypothetical protein TNCV_2499791 [Trichonephila clavipes]
MIVRARFVGASVSRTVNLVGVSRTTVTRSITVYTNLDKIFSAKHTFGRKSKLKDRDRRVLKAVLKATAKDKPLLALYHEEFRGP